MNNKHGAFEAEMRRRLWWALASYDSRVSELCNSKATVLVPLWDCKTPSNLNDSDLRPDIKILPAPHGGASEATFMVVRYEIANFIRHSGFFLEFLDPSYKRFAGGPQHDLVAEVDEITATERAIQQKYFMPYDEENPIQFTAFWTAQWFLAKVRLLNHYATYGRSSAPQTEEQRDAVTSHALDMLECDTKLLTSPVGKNFYWFAVAQFPLPGYTHVVQDLRKRPSRSWAHRAWQVLSDNYETRFINHGHFVNPLVLIIAKIVVQAWAAHKSACSQPIEESNVPPFVVYMEQSLDITRPDLLVGSAEQSTTPMSAPAHNPNPITPLPSTAFDEFSPSAPLVWPIVTPASLAPGQFSSRRVMPLLGNDPMQWGWSAIDWNQGDSYGWQ